MYIYIYVCISVCPSVRLLVCLSVCLTIWSMLRPSVWQLVRPSVPLSSQLMMMGNLIISHLKFPSSLQAMVIVRNKWVLLGSDVHRICIARIYNAMKSWRKKKTRKSCLAKEDKPLAYLALIPRVARWGKWRMWIERKDKVLRTDSFLIWNRQNDGRENALIKHKQRRLFLQQPIDR